MLGRGFRWRRVRVLGGPQDQYHLWQLSFSWRHLWQLSFSWRRSSAACVKIPSMPPSDSNTLTTHPGPSAHPLPIPLSSPPLNPVALLPRFLDASSSISVTLLRPFSFGSLVLLPFVLSPSSWQHTNVATLLLGATVDLHSGVCHLSRPHYFIWRRGCEAESKGS